MSLLQTIEGILNDNHLNRLEVIENRYAIKVKVYRPVKNVFNSVYGRESGEEFSQEFDVVDAIVIGDDFFPQDSYAAGGFKEGILYTSSDKVNIGDMVSLDRDDFKTRRYSVQNVQVIGSSQKVFKKFRISALGD